MREREREENFFARGKGSVFEHTHTHTSQNTRRKKICQVKKRKVSSPPLVSIPTFAPTGKVARIFPSRSFSLALDGGQMASIDRSIEARARARRSGTSDRWDRGRLPSLRETTHRIVRGKWGGGRDRSNPTPQ